MRLRDVGTLNAQHLHLTEVQRAENTLLALGEKIGINIENTPGLLEVIQLLANESERQGFINGFSYGYTVKLVAKYREKGLAAIVENHYGGNHRNMSNEEEAALLEPFRKKAEAGQIVEISEIEGAYRKAVGHSVGTAQIYYVLHRHKWRKVMPRSKHPKKASEEVITTSKKLTPELQS